MRNCIFGIPGQGAAAKRFFCIFAEGRFPEKDIYAYLCKAFPAVMSGCHIRQESKIWRDYEIEVSHFRNFNI